MGSRRKGKKVKRAFLTLTKQAYQAAGGRFDLNLAIQCAYYPRLAFNKLVCEGCSFDEPRCSCIRAHILEDSNLRRCELCFGIDDGVILIEHHTLHPLCLQRVLDACEEAERSEEDGTYHTGEGVVKEATNL